MVGLYINLGCNYPPFGPQVKKMIRMPTGNRPAVPIALIIFPVPPASRDRMADLRLTFDSRLWIFHAVT